MGFEMITIPARKLTPYAIPARYLNYEGIVWIASRGDITRERRRQLKDHAQKHYPERFSALDFGMRKLYMLKYSELKTEYLVCRINKRHAVKKEASTRPEYTDADFPRKPREIKVPYSDKVLMYWRCKTDPDRRHIAGAIKQQARRLYPDEFKESDFPDGRTTGGRNVKAPNTKTA